MCYMTGAIFKEMEILNSKKVCANKEKSQRVAKKRFRNSFKNEAISSRVKCLISRICLYPKFVSYVRK